MALAVILFLLSATILLPFAYSHANGLRFFADGLRFFEGQIAERKNPVRSAVAVRQVDFTFNFRVKSVSF